MPLAAGRTLTHYEILGPLGAGGMGEVYRAKDTRLEREVAIKVLPEQLAGDEERLRRFEREAKTLASLSHANLAHVYGIDQVDDVCFIAMELVPGEDLATRLARGKLPVDEALDVCRQIADGLESAHEAGVVHRDLKPANVRVTSEGVVKLLDFGLAKPIRPSASGESGTTIGEPDSFLLTKEGLILGTPTYMSPEQARGRQVDRRTDIWAFGCVLYECLTGRRAFSGESLTDVLAAIVGTEPDWSSLPAETPPRVVALLRRCLDKSPRTRLRDIGEARLELTPPASAGSSTVRATTPLRMTTVAALLIGVGLALAWGLRGLGGDGAAGSPDAVAVLPFVNESGDPEMDYLADGIAESLINRLSDLPDLRVVPRNTAFRHRGREEELEAVADELGVRTVVTGRVSRRGDQLIVSAELTDAREVSQLWGDRFDTSIDRILVVESSISARIGDALRVELSGEASPWSVERYTDSPVAHLAFMEARHAWASRRSDGFQRALELYGKAIEADPSFALAHAGKAETYVLMTFYLGSGEVYLRLLRREVATVIQLDPELAEAYPALGYALTMERRWAEAEEAFRKAIRLRPDYATAHHWYGVFLVALGDVDGAVEAFEEAHRLDPGSAVIAHDSATILLLMGKPEEALARTEEILEATPDFWRSIDGRGRAYCKLGRFAEAAREFEHVRELIGEIAYTDGALVYAYGMAGDLEKAREELRRLEQRAEVGYVSSFGFAWAYAGLREFDTAFEWLERAARDGDPLLAISWLMMEDELAADPRWAHVVELLELPG